MNHIMKLQYTLQTIFLKWLTGHIRSAREWYQWIFLSKDMPRYSFFIFDLGFLKEVQNSSALHAQIYLITDGLGGRQA